MKRAEMIPAEVARQPIAAALSAYDPAKYNLASPIHAVDALPPFHRVSVRIVIVQGPSELYPIPGAGDRVGLAKTLLDRIAAAGGISWCPERSGQIDVWNDPYRVKYRAVGEIRDFDGARRVISGERVIDLRGESGDAEEDLGADAREFLRTTRNGDPWARIISARQHISSLAESKAKLRAIRGALSIPVAMPKAEALRPWVVPQLVPDLPTDDPEIRRALALHLIGAQAALYGPPAAPAAMPARLSAAPVIERDEPAAVTVESDPWDDTPEAEGPGETTPASVPDVLPISERDLQAIPDPKRQAYLRRLSTYADEIIAASGLETGLELLRQCTQECDPMTAPLDEVAALGRALRELRGGAA